MPVELMKGIVSVLVLLSIAVPFGAYFLRGKKHGKRYLLMNIISFFTVAFISFVFILSGNVEAAPAAEAAASGADGLKYLSAAMVTGLACIGAGVAVASAAPAGLGAISENEGIFGKALIFVALAEGIALYGLLISFAILSK